MGRVHRNKTESEVEDLDRKTTHKSIDLDLNDDWAPRLRRSKHVPNDKRNQVNIELFVCFHLHHFIFFSRCEKDETVPSKIQAIPKSLTQRLQCSKIGTLRTRPSPFFRTSQS